MRRVLLKMLSVLTAAALAASMMPIVAFGVAPDADSSQDVVIDGTDEIPSVPDNEDSDFDLDDPVLKDEDPELDESVGESASVKENDDSSNPNPDEPLDPDAIELEALEVSQPDDNITAFVKRLYQYVLGRNADVAGLKTHTDALRSGTSAANLAWAFFGSPEFQKRGLTDDQRLDTAYLAMFDRAADPSGKQTYGAMLKTGMSMMAVISAFSNSPEYRALCARWGIAPGVLNVVENRDKNQNATAFVQRLYQKVLGRTADTGGLNVHTGSLLSGGSAAGVAWAFFGSPEFQGRGLTDDQRLDTAYLAMFDRAADPSGKQTYGAMLKTGMSMMAVISAFSNSPEYRALCARWGIAPGVLNVVENRDKNQNATAFVQRLYQKVLGRSADVGGLNTHTGALASTGSAARVAWSFFGSSEFENRNLTNEQKVELVYQAMFDRGADSEGMATYRGMLDKGMSLMAVVSAFSRSDEYRALCSKWSIPAGVLVVSESRDRNQNITAFVQRLYQKVLGRPADVDGLNAHTGYLLTGGDASNLAWAFFSAPEFMNRNLSNEAKVEIAYQAMLDRNPDPQGKADWVAKLNGGESLRSIISGFAGSNEFRKLCEEYGIAADEYWTMDSRATNLSSRTNWLIAVDTNRCLVTVYNGSRGNWNPVRRFACSPGKPSTPSRKGVFTVGIKGYVFGSGYSCYYYTQYSGDYLFHSILYDPGTFSVQDGTMGRPVSHGCIRLWIENAKYIYDNVPSGSTVLVF